MSTPTTNSFIAIFFSTPIDIKWKIRHIVGGMLCWQGYRLPQKIGQVKYGSSLSAKFPRTEHPFIESYTLRTTRICLSIEIWMLNNIVQFPMVGPQLIGSCCWSGISIWSSIRRKPTETSRSYNIHLGHSVATTACAVMHTAHTTKHEYTRNSLMYAIATN